MADTISNRNMRKWTNSELFRRLLWAIVQPLFRFSPRLFWAWRVALLRLFGAKIGKSVHIYPSVSVVIPWNLSVGDYSAIGFETLVYSLGEISIGEHVTISHKSHLCAGTHDYSDVNMPLVKAGIEIGDHVWLCSQSFIGPGVKVAGDAIVGAGSVVVADVEAAVIVGGNPARVLRRRAPIEK